ncbi:MAG: hypothetical protein GKS00_28295 [Alphaproteobacteria bacterium]|nr:hypothetical protein [Alphaproteobacteria bacterium]
MLISTDAETAKQTEATYMVDDQPYKGWEYIGSAPKPGTPGYGKDVAGEDVPQAYLVIQPPHSVTRPHFHQTNQFQVFVHGGGTVGKMRVDPLTVQYAGGNTPYGPIIAEDDGVQYFTLRQAWDSGAKYLPANRDLLVKGQQRQVVGVKSGAGETETLIEPTADGLFAQCVTLAPGAKHTLPDASEGGGQYHVVVSGSLARDGEDLPPLSVEFASPDEGLVEIEAGPDGLELLLARFPKEIPAK